MKGFEVDKSGDIVVKNGEIQMVSGNDLTAQKIQLLIGTNLGEWFLNKNEGVDIYCFTGKKINDDEIQDNIRSALKQVDERLELSYYERIMKEQRKAVYNIVVTIGDESINLTLGEE